MEEQNTKHTPGPWSRTLAQGGRTATVFGGAGEEIAAMVGDAKTQNANARLLENAPALLAFAQMIAGGGINEAGEAQIEAEARELIRAATGQE